MPVEAPPCGQAVDRELEDLIEEARRRARRRRLGYLIVAIVGLAIAGTLFLTLAGGGREPSPRPRIAHPQATPVPPEAVLRRHPYMGVSCRVANSFACDRVGLAVWLRQPAVGVKARLGGGEFDLDDPAWSEPATDGRRRMFAGFLQPAGLIDGAIEVTPDAGPNRWIGRKPVSARVRLWIASDHGAVDTTTIRVRLWPGWG